MMSVQETCRRLCRNAGLPGAHVQEAYVQVFVLDLSKRPYRRGWQPVPSLSIPVLCPVRLRGHLLLIPIGS